MESTSCAFLGRGRTERGYDDDDDDDDDANDDAWEEEEEEDDDGVMDDVFMDVSDDLRIDHVHDLSSDVWINTDDDDDGDDIVLENDSLEPSWLSCLLTKHSRRRFVCSEDGGKERGEVST